MNQRLALFSFISLTSLSLLGASCGQTAQAPNMDTEPSPQATANTASANLPAYTIDTENSILKWNASKITGKHFGTVKIQSGSVAMSENEPVSGSFVMDMTTITVDDMAVGEKMHGMLFNHLRSDDFFSVETHPTASFTAKAFTKKEGSTYRVDGDLTIKGITKPISFDAVITPAADQVAATAVVTIDRTEFDIKFRSGKFFSDLGDSLIHDTFTIELNLIASA